MACLNGSNHPYLRNRIVASTPIDKSRIIQDNYGHHESNDTRCPASSSPETPNMNGWYKPKSQAIKTTLPLT